MSGPITAGYFLVSATLAAVAEAMRQAHAMKQDYADVLAQLQRRERDMAAARQQHRAARLDRLAAMHAQAAQLAAREAHLRELAQALGADTHAVTATPTPPAGDAGDAAWNAHLGALNGTIATLEHALGQLSAAGESRVRAAIAAVAAPGKLPTIDDVLASHVLQRQAQATLADDDAERFRATAARVLGRLELPQGQALPVELQALARSVIMAPSVERAEALATELRRAVQLARASRDDQARASSAARQLLNELPDATPSVLVAALERVAAGIEPLDPSLRKAAQDVLDAAAVEREHNEQQAAALVLQESLRDLGYEVADIESTLFVDGGSIHFRREGWESYAVRMRVAPNQKTVNFNVVRPRGAEENAERRRQDALAEDRWCAEFPKLLQTLAARGLELDVTRRLAAGEVPVQVVDPAILPAIQAHDEAPAAPAPLQRPLG